MRRWLVTFDDAWTHAESPGRALEQRLDDDSIPIGATVFVVDLDAAIEAGIIERFRVGAERLPLEEVESG